MASNVPVIRKINWLAVLFQILFIYGIFLIFNRAKGGDPILFTALTYFILARLLRSVFSKYHREGMKQMMKKDYNGAIGSFQASYDWFIKHPLADKYRFLTLLSASGISYTSMALDNIAFSYSQSGNGLKATEYYKKALELNPKDGIAQAGLNMLSSMENSGTANPESAS